MIVGAGPLKGARYTDVCLDDLRKAAKSYKQDPRFNQYAKRVMSERALGSGHSAAAVADTSKTLKTRCSEWGAWIVSKAKGRTFLVLLLCIGACIVLSRPLFYIVIAKSLTIAVRLLLRRSVGLVVLLVDAILDEAAANLEASLLTAPVPQHVPQQHTSPAFEVQQHSTYATILMHLFFTAVGVFLGRHWRAQLVVRPAPPTRLRVA